MAAKDQTDMIPVLPDHLETLLSTLDRALKRSMAEDLVEHYRSNRGNNPQQSVLTTYLQRAVERVGGYLGVDEYE